MPRTGLSAEQIREKAIEATVSKIREVGFEKVRLTDIAKELKVSHAALYTHFKDKSDLLDAVSKIWLQTLDESLDSLCLVEKNPCEKIHDWALAIHRTKIEKVRLDPELFSAFDMAAQQDKPFVQEHLENLHRQLYGLVEEAIAEKRLKNADAEAMTNVIASAVMAFHHPRLVAFYIEQEREPLLREVVDTVLKGLNLKR